jgi:hypothetical protein
MSDMAGGLGSRSGGVFNGRAQQEAAEIQGWSQITHHFHIA